MERKTLSMTPFPLGSDERRRLITGIGSALVDIMAFEDDSFLERAGAIKGGMTYVEHSFFDQTLAAATDTPKMVSGGSACNTMMGIGKLGGQARFVGKCGNGSMGQLFRRELKNSNVEPLLFASASPTGKVLSIVTPDAERSMFTFLGASAETKPEEITPACFEAAAIVHIEGYLVFNEALILSALNAAKAAGALVSLDLASFNIVKESKRFLEQIISEYVDILIANEEEAFTFSSCTSEAKALDSLSQNTKIAVLKLGPRGSRIAYNGDVTVIAPHGDGMALDSTGAGDLWASGFLFGLVNGKPLSECGRLGSILGYEVCQVMGANIAEAGWQRIRKMTEEEWPQRR
jgi:sugar/nucleoside kinase (ribokinase family)